MVLRPSPIICLIIFLLVELASIDLVNSTRERNREQASPSRRSPAGPSSSSPPQARDPQNTEPQSESSSQTQSSNPFPSSVSAQFSTAAAAGAHPPLPAAALLQLQRPPAIPLTRGTHQSTANIPSSSTSFVPMPFQHAVAATAVGLEPHQRNEASTSASGPPNSSSQHPPPAAAAAAGLQRIINLTGVNATPAVQQAFHQEFMRRAIIASLENQLAEIDKPGERYNFRPLAHILFEIYDFIKYLTMVRPFEYTIDDEAEKRAFITSQFTDHKFDGTGQFFLPHWIDPAGQDVYSILLAKYPYTVLRPFDVQVYGAIPIDSYNVHRHYTEDRGKINIHSFLPIFIDRRTQRLEPHLHDQLFPAIEQNCAGEGQFNLCIVQHVMCFGVQLHYNLTLLKAYALRASVEFWKTTNQHLLNWDAQYEDRRRTTYESPLEFYVDSIRSKFYAQWMQETAETITRLKDIKLVPNPISQSTSLKAQIQHKLATIRNKYEKIAVNMIEAVKDRRKRGRGEE